MKLTLLSLLVGANVFAATPGGTQATATNTQPSEKIQFQMFTSNDTNNYVTQPLQLLTLENSKPETYSVDVRYLLDPKAPFAEGSTFWKTAYVTKYHRAQLAQWLQCLNYDPEAYTCATLTGIDFKPMKSKVADLRADVQANYDLAKNQAALHGAVFINGMRYEGPLAYGVLLNETNALLSKNKQLANIGKYTPSKLWVIGTTDGFGKRDLAFERDLQHWVPGLQIEVVSPDSSKGMALLTESESTKIPAYVFDKTAKSNVAVEKLAVAGRVKLNKAGYAAFEIRNGTTEIKTVGKQTTNTLDLWVMSQCPYGVRAENAYLAAQTQNLVKQGVKVNVRYIIGEQQIDGKKKWNSLHGDQELQEDIRQITIQKTWPETFWKYIQARNADLKADWKTAATTVGLNPEQIEKKMSVGEKQIAQDLKDSNALKISGSPTYLWENRYVLGNNEDMKAALGYDATAVLATPTANKATDHRNPASKTEKKEAAAPSGAQCG